MNILKSNIVLYFNDTNLEIADAQSKYTECANYLLHKYQENVDYTINTEIFKYITSNVTTTLVLRDVNISIELCVPTNTISINYKDDSDNSSPNNTIIPDILNILQPTNKNILPLDEVLDLLYDQPEKYPNVINFLNLDVLSKSSFEESNDYDYREYLNDEIKEELKNNCIAVAMLTDLLKL